MADSPEWRPDFTSTCATRVKKRSGIRAGNALLGMIERSNLVEIQEATGWYWHCVLGVFDANLVWFRRKQFLRLGVMV